MCGRPTSPARPPSSRTACTPCPTVPPANRSAGASSASTAPSTSRPPRAGVTESLKPPSQRPHRWLHGTGHRENGVGVRRLNGMDAMLLYSETPNLHTHTLKVAVIDARDFDGEFSYDVFRRTIQRRLHLLDPLRYRLVDIPWKMHHPMWMEDCPVDLLPPAPRADPGAWWPP